MNKIWKTCAIATSGIRDFLERNKRYVAAAAFICFVFGLVLSHRIEPGVQVQKATLAEDTPALKFIPAGPGPHPVALLAHGLTASKEAFFRFAEALTAAGFVCYAVDLPGHGASPRTFTIIDTVHTLEAVAREVGPLDVFVGHSMGGFTGGEAVREGGMKPGLFIAIGSFPALGDHAPPMLLLEGGWFDMDVTPALLKTRTNARLVISPWSNHLCELADPFLVNAAVEAACASVHKTPPPPPTAWRWRLLGIVLALIGAGKLANCLTDLFPQLAQFRGLFIAVFVVVAFMLTVGYAWLDTAPHLRFFPKQGATMAVMLLLAMIAGRLRIPRWSFAVLGVLVMVIAFCWLKVSGSLPFLLSTFFFFFFTPVLIAGTAIGWIAARRGSRIQGDIVMAIIVGCALFQWLEPPRKAAAAPLKPHTAIKLAPKQYEAYVGDYEFPPDNCLSLIGMELTIWRQGDELRAQPMVMNKNSAPFEIYPESETNFFSVLSSSDLGGRPSIGNSPLQFTFVKNDKGETTAVILHLGQDLPDSEGKKLKSE